MSFAGLRGSGDWGADERPKSFREMVLRLNPNGRAPLFALTARMSRQPVDDAEHAWWEKEMYVPRVRHTGLSVATASTAVTLDAIDGANNSKGNGLDLRAGDLLMFEEVPDGTALAGEIMEVSSVTDANNIVVKRAQAGTSAQGQAASSFLVRVGNRFSEGSTSPAVTSRNPVKLHNFVQIFKTAYEVTDVAQATRTRTEPALLGEQRDKAFEHAASVEFATFFGERSETTGSNGKPLRTMRGLLRFLSTNLTAWDDTTFTQSNMIDFFGSIFNNTADGVTNERICFCGNKFLTKMNEVIATATNTQFQFTGTLKLYGMEMQRYVTPHGTVAFRTHPLLTQNNRYNGSCVVISPPGLRLRPLKGLDTRVDKGPTGKGIQANDAATLKHQWLSYLTLEVMHESTMGWAHYLL